MNIKKIIVSIFMVIMVSGVYAQNAGDALYNRGIEAQKTRTISSQKQAIEFYTKAKVAYESKDNKDKCDQKIAECNRNIEKFAQLSKEKSAREKGNALFNIGEKLLQESNYIDAQTQFQDAKDAYMSAEDKDKCQVKIDLCKSEINKLIETPKVEDFINIFADDADITDCPQIAFQNKKSESKILVVKASREDWTYTNNSPTWLSVSQDKSSSTLTLLIPGKNKGGIRSAIVTVTSGDKSVQITVTQQADFFKMF